MQSMKKAFGMLKEFDRISKLFSENDLGKQLHKANYDAQMAWGNDADKYNEAMNRVEKLRMRIKY